MYLRLGLRIGSASVGEAPPGPVNTVVPVISGTFLVGETLTVTTGTWAGTGTITYAYQWQRNGSPIAGATSSTYEIIEADRSTALSCRVTATDDLGSRSRTSNSLIPDQATAAGALGPYSFTEGVAISATNLAADFTANGNTLTYAMVSALPSALVVSSVGSMTGTPEAETALASYTVRATDAYGRTTDSTFTLVTVPATQAWSFSDGDLVVSIPDDANEGWGISDGDLVTDIPEAA